MIIIGLDPGTATTGYGVLKKGRRGQYECLKYGVIETPKTKAPGERLCILEKSLARLLAYYKPSLVVVEKHFFFKNLKTALPVSEARGVILLVLTKKKIKSIELSPLQVKSVMTGYGRADKKQIQRMVKKFLGLQELPKPDDAADALALAITGMLGLKPGY